MRDDNALLLVMMILGVASTLFIFKGISGLSLEERTNKTSKFHISIGLLSFGVLTWLAVIVYVFYRLRFFSSITDDGFGFLCSIFVALALLVSDLYVVINAKKIDNRVFVSVSRSALPVAIGFVLALVFYWIKWHDKIQWFLK